MYICKKCKQTYSIVRLDCEKCGGKVVNRYENVGVTGIVLGGIASLVALCSIAYLVVSYSPIIFGVSVPAQLFGNIVRFLNYPILIGLVCAIAGTYVCKDAIKMGATNKIVSIAKTLCSISLIINVVGWVVCCIDYLLILTNSSL